MMPKQRTIWIYFFGLVLTPIIASTLFFGSVHLLAFLEHLFEDSPHRGPFNLIDFVFLEFLVYFSFYIGLLNLFPMLLVVQIAEENKKVKIKYFIVTFGSIGLIITLLGSAGFALLMPALIIIGTAAGALSGIVYWYCVARYWTKIDLDHHRIAN